jgi:thioredoxin-related protein
MKPENYINVIEKLNTEITEYVNGLNDLGICLDYTTTNYVDMINFMGFCIWCSEIDEDIDSEEELEEIIKKKILSLESSLHKWLNKISD